MPDTKSLQPKSQKVIKVSEPKSPQAISDDKKQKAQVPTSASVGRAKEQEPTAATEAIARAEEDKIMAEIYSTSEATRKEALDRIEKELPDLKEKRQELKLPPDVEDAGVKIPEEEADNVIKQGTTLSLPTSEEAYKNGQHTKVSGKIEGAPGQKIVVGVSSVAALAIWIGRLFKLAHKQAMKVVFRKKEGA